MALPKFTRPQLAYVLPFVLFMAGLAVSGIIGSFAEDDSPFWISDSIYWVFPLQTFLCAGAIAFYWKEYEWGPLNKIPIGIFWGIVVFFVWVSPQMFFGAPGRFDGFEPSKVGENGALIAATIAIRFFRLAVVVPFLEEIFWRGFLMRYFVKEDFQSVRFGTATLGSFSAVVILFAFVHSFTDFFGAIVAGVVFNGLAVSTKSLAACVVAHAVTNLLLGIYIMQTGQWGFW